MIYYLLTILSTSILTYFCTSWYFAVKQIRRIRFIEHCLVELKHTPKDANGKYPQSTHFEIIKNEAILHELNMAL